MNAGNNNNRRNNRSNNVGSNNKVANNNVAKNNGSNNNVANNKVVNNNVANNKVANNKVANNNVAKNNGSNNKVANNNVKNNKAVEEKDGTRYFEVVHAVAKGNGKYTVSTHTALKENRFKATSKQTPVDAAKKALTSLCELTPKNKSCSQRIVLRELTRGSDHKLYFYNGERRKYDTPKVVKLTSTLKNGTKKTVERTFHFDPKVTAISESELGHSHILGNWKVKKNNSSNNKNNSSNQ